MALPKVLTMFVPNKGDKLNISLTKSDSTGEETLKIATPDGGLLCASTKTSNAVMFGVGASGISRGIYDVAGNKWIYHYNETIGTEIVAPTEKSIIALKAGKTVVNNGLRLYSQGICNEDGTGGVSINYRPENVTGAWGAFCNKVDAHYNGGFFFDADNNVTSCRLLGMPSGSLTWNSKPVETVESSGENYVRYKSGLQICWGNSRGGKFLIVNLPVPYMNTNYVVFFIGSNRLLYGADVETTTSIALGACAPSLAAQVPDRGFWLTIGKWK